jgi:hypothetical protein
MKGQLFMADYSPAFGTSPDEKSGAFPANQVYKQCKCTLQILKGMQF